MQLVVLLTQSTFFLRNDNNLQDIVNPKRCWTKQRSGCVGDNIKVRLMFRLRLCRYLISSFSVLKVLLCKLSKDLTMACKQVGVHLTWSLLPIIHRPSSCAERTWTFSAVTRLESHQGSVLSRSGSLHFRCLAAPALISLSQIRLFGRTDRSSKQT